MALTKVSGSMYNLAVVSKTGTYTATVADDVVLCSGAAFTVTLPAASLPGKVIRLKKTDSSFTNIITIARAGSDTIDGATSTTLNTLNETVALVSDGVSSWILLERYSNVKLTAYTPTFTNFGTVTGNTLCYGRDREHLILQGAFVSGTGVGSTASLTLPSGLVPSSTIGSSQVTGTCFVSAASQSNSIAVLTASASNTFYLGVSSNATAGATTPINGNTFGNTVTFLINARIPISGWN